MRVLWTPVALDDLKTISDRIEQERDLATANRVCRTLYDAIQMLRDTRSAAGGACYMLEGPNHSGHQASDPKVDRAGVWRWFS